MQPIPLQVPMPQRPEETAAMQVDAESIRDVDGASPVMSFFLVASLLILVIGAMALVNPRRFKRLFFRQANDNSTKTSAVVISPNIELCDLETPQQHEHEEEKEEIRELVEIDLDT